MCGIAGACQQPDGKVVVTTMVERSRTAAGRERVVELVDPGHRRSSSATGGCRSSTCRSAADQPFAKGGLTLSYNGEIYNYRELRRELESLGAPVRHGLRHRGGARGVARLGAGRAAAVPRDVRLRDPRRAPRATSRSPATRSASSRST